MAMFHFRLKSDKKPDGTKISAVQHVDYIRREGNFANLEQWQQNNKFCGNFISSAKIKNTLDGQNILLYKTDDFGSIRNSKNGIEVTEKASPTTLSIALMLADETLNHNPLIINGSADFKKSVLKAAIIDNLPISFADKLLQNEFKHQKENIENDRKNFVANGGTLISNRPNPKPSIAPTHAQTIESAAKIGLRLPTLSKLSVVHSKSKGTDLLLQNDESGKLEQLARDSYNNLRWNFSNERKKLAEWTAKKILERVEDTILQVVAAVFFTLTTCLIGRKMTPKNFLKPPINTKAKEIAAIWKLNLLFLMS